MRSDEIHPFRQHGLEISRLVLGCRSFGDQKRGAHPWTLDEESSRPLICQAVEAGINFFDTSSWSGVRTALPGRLLTDPDDVADHPSDTNKPEEA